MIEGVLRTNRSLIAFEGDYGCFLDEKKYEDLKECIFELSLEDISILFDSRIIRFRYRRQLIWGNQPPAIS